MYKIIGIMTGNSLDAVDVVLTVFDGDKITDVDGISVPYPDSLRDSFLSLRRHMDENDPDMETLKGDDSFIQTHDAYIHLVADTVKGLLNKAGLSPKDITAVGFHGQTVDHCGPAVAKASGKKPYTTQVGSGQMLADLIGIPVIYDFRSDDVMAGSEGAPLAPTHNQNLAHSLGISSAVFFNAGNTSNVAVVTGDKVIGWDAGPFNELVNKMIRIHKNESCDWNGQYGLSGHVNRDLLERLYQSSAVTADGANYLDLMPPKSSDPKWYRFLDCLMCPDHFEDKVATVEYFAGYVAAHTLKYVPQDIQMPTDFILFGGGWHNPVCRQAFEDLINGRGFVLPAHQKDFEGILARFEKTPVLQLSNWGHYMEARIFADLARYYLQDKPWITDTVGSHRSVRLGRRRDPHQGPVDDRINRAAKGWQDKHPAI